MYVVSAMYYLYSDDDNDDDYLLKGTDLIVSWFEIDI